MTGIETLPNVASQVRSLGLNVGDTIEGTESGSDWFNTTRLTLLWVGNQEAAWLHTHKSNKSEMWSRPVEVANWILSHRDWRKVENE